jgi:hypothetical protein
MRQIPTAEMRRDEGKATSSGGQGSGEPSLRPPRAPVAVDLLPCMAKKPDNALAGAEIRKMSA